MKRQVVTGLLLLSLAGCSAVSESRLNPFNWFKSGETEGTLQTYQTPVDPALTDTRPLVSNVVTLNVERAAGGAIVRASGLAPGYGYYGAELVPLAGEIPVNGSLVYFFRIEPPIDGPRLSGEQARTLTVGRFVRDSVLNNASSIVVRGQNNQMRSAR